MSQFRGSAGDGEHLALYHTKARTLRRWTADLQPRVRGATTFLRLDLSQTPSLPQRRWVLRLTGCGHVDNASALPTGSTAHNSQFEARKPEYPSAVRSHAVSETPTDSSEEAFNVLGSCNFKWLRVAETAHPTTIARLIGRSVFGGMM